MIDGDVVLEPEPPANRNDDREDHPDAGEDCAGDEIRWKDRRVPPGRERHGEVERHYRVHRQHEWCRERRKE